ncbi:hypothetical protein NMG60_11020201 [Bertholletia excelsa]
MADGRVRLAAGVMGNAASLLLYAAPILTFHKVIRKRSTEDFSCVPYVTAFSNCFLYTWYGLPVVSCGWENFSLVTINGLGVLLELSFIITYFRFASVGGKKKVAMLAIPVILVSCAAAIISAFVFHDHHRRKVFIGSVGLVACVSMYGSPLVAVKKVIQTKSVKFMPFYLSFFSFLASSIWLAYGFLSRDLFLASPSLVGCPLAVLQLLVYCKYRKKGVMEEPHKSWDVEKNNNGEKTKQQLQLVVPGDTSVARVDELVFS